jgi:hypothetical protein
MSSTAESLLKRTGKSLSLLAFETSKQSRILKKKMRITAMQKEVKADLRDLGRIVYEAVRNKHDDVLKNQEVTILVENVANNNHEIERLREAIERISRAKKTFIEDDTLDAAASGAAADEAELEPEKPAEEPPATAKAATEKEPCCSDEGKPCDDAGETKAPVEVAAQAEPVLEEKPKPARRKRATTPRKRKTTKTATKASTKSGDEK